MFKNRFLNTSAFFMAPDNETGSETEKKPVIPPVKTPEQIAQEERDAIEVTAVSSAKDDPKEGEDEDEDDSDEEEDKETEEETDDEDHKNETEDEKKVRLAGEKEKRKQDRQQRRIDRITARAKAAEDKAAALEKQLAEKVVDGLTEEEVARRAEELAEKKLKEKQNAEIAAQFEKDKSTLQSQAVKADPKFDDNVSEMADECGLIPSVMIGILADLDNKNGGEVLAHLAKEDNWELYEELRGLNPVKMGIRLERLSDKIKSEKKPANGARERSKAPAPMPPVEESRSAPSTTITGKESTEEYVRKRNAQEAAKRQARGY